MCAHELEPCSLKDYDESGAKRDLAMQINLPRDLETLVNKRLSSGAYESIEEVFRRALEAQDAEESWTDEERRALSAHIEEGFLQAQRGELIDGAKASRDLQEMKDNWRQERPSEW
jgi:Arc/MetJ-type ribon-helix-helix transcriptional regulator